MAEQKRNLLRIISIMESRMEKTKRIINQALGEIKYLPLVFESRLLCVNCLYIGSLVITGGVYKCFNCGFTCSGTIVLTKQGLLWLKMCDLVHGK